MNDPLENPDFIAAANRLRSRRPGAVKFFSERFGGRPFDNCMINAWMGVGAFIGYDIQDGDDDVIRLATGVPDPNGLSFGELKQGISTIFTDDAWTIGVADWDFILANIKRYGYRGMHRAQFTVALNMSKMPDEYRHWCGLSYNGGHSVRLISRNSAGTDFYYYDVMQPTTPPKDAPEGWLPGGWVSKDILDAAVFRNKDGLIRVTYGYRNGYAGPIYTPPTPPTE